MPRIRRNESNTAVQDDDDIGESEAPRLTADNLARCDAAVREAELRRRAEARFGSHEPLMSDNLAWRAWSDSATTAIEDNGRDQLTAANLGQHDAEMEEADRPILSAADLARHNAAIKNQRANRSLQENYDYTKTGWRRAGHREGYGGLLEPRAGRRRP